MSRRRRSTLLLAGALTLVATLAIAGVSVWQLTRGASPNTAAGGPITCWDGAKVARAVQCSIPRGEVGLRWVYPSLDRDIDTCEEAGELPDKKVRSWFCSFRGSPDDGVRYSEWPSTGEAAAEFARNYSNQPRHFLLEGRRAGLVWERDDRNADGLFRKSFAYDDWPFSLSIAGSSQRALARACDRVVLRSPRSLSAVDCKESAQRAG